MRINDGLIRIFRWSAAHIGTVISKIILHIVSSTNSDHTNEFFLTLSSKANKEYVSFALLLCFIERQISIVRVQSGASSPKRINQIDVVALETVATTRIVCKRYSGFTGLGMGLLFDNGC